MIRSSSHAVFLAMLTCSAPALAGIQVAGTRVIYPAQESEVTVHVRNDDNGPRLLQVWVDDGDSRATAQNTTAPFFVTPPISRIESNKAQTLRLVRTGAKKLPEDRESVFWLNVLEIPPRPKNAANENILQFAVRTRLKIFYRPASLTGRSSDAYKQVTWSVADRKGEKVITCSNLSGFNVSFASIVSTNTHSAVADGGMCPAKGQAEFHAKGDVISGMGLVVNIVNDYGGMDRRAAVIKG